MPREFVRSADYNFVPVEPGEDGGKPWDPECRMGQVAVGWTKAPTGHVEVCTSDLSMLSNPDGLYAQIAQAVADGRDVETVVRDFFAPGGGFHVVLDRDGCNDLVRRIRKARDDAFGRDQ